MKFNPGFDIYPLYNPLGFRYGQDVFGPQVENRSLDSIRQNLMDPNCQGPDIVYAIAMDVGRNQDKKEMLDRNLLYGVVTYAKGQLGKEPVRSQGHIHALSPSCQMSTCEVYEIWTGEAYIYMQETAIDNPGRCFAVHAKPGEVVIVPPGWAHCTIVADIHQNLTFGAWCVRDYGFDYQDVRAHKGVAWFPIVEQDKIEFIANSHYHKSHLIIKEPRQYTEFQIEKEKSIYQQFIENPDKFMFVSRPQDYQELWKDFIP
ncbi:glucose-6-phosphate isomerase [Allocoprobacillus halotolerans]|uniref:glucose-6-phosphate isomerase n=1 Tax=Allocoprobacillus halotolerans TaxID=2944914 RepID=A0ABY5I735_9FIRM|nr:glucose-6-phosphate isomerase family protein [Allocoprobacillus halotolerans]UTY39767.1 glucose-6-phosphate isomerase [Allocoprobacillus halotolerans]